MEDMAKMQFLHHRLQLVHNKVVYELWHSRKSAIWRQHYYNYKPVIIQSIKTLIGQHTIISVR